MTCDCPSQRRTKGGESTSPVRFVTVSAKQSIYNRDRLCFPLKCTNCLLKKKAILPPSLSPIPIFLGRDGKKGGHTVIVGAREVTGCLMGSCFLSNIEPISMCSPAPSFHPLCDSPLSSVCARTQPLLMNQRKEGHITAAYSADVLCVTAREEGRTVTRRHCESCLATWGSCPPVCPSFRPRAQPPHGSLMVAAHTSWLVFCF